VTKLSYVDTSVIIAALDTRDPRFRVARELLEKEKYKVVSEIVLSELASVVARREDLVSSIAVRLGLGAEEAIIAILVYIIKRFSLKCKSVGGRARIPLLGDAYKPIAVAVELSPRTKLRTIDLLHVAYAMLLKDEGEPIERLVTLDKDFEKARDTLKNAGIELHIIE
jgi:predicted nucleic acid-binding protein